MSRHLLIALLLLPLAGTGDEKESPNSELAVEEHLFEPVDAARSGRIVPVKIYLAGGDSPKPVVLFSHGLGGSREGNPYLGNHWARAGYLCVFLQHAGSDRDVWASAPLGERMRALQEAASARSTRDRFADVSFIIDQLEKWNADPEHPLSGKFDLEHIGMSGHSFGAVTTMGVAGRKFPVPGDVQDERLDAFLPMSPNVANGITPAEAFGHLTKPILCMTGTEDGSPLEPTLDPATRQQVYAALPPGDKYQLVLEGAEHSAFGDGGGRRDGQRNPDHHPVILALSTRFWDAYLKNDESAKQWLQSAKPKEETPMAEADRWEWK